MTKRRQSRPFAGLMQGSGGCGPGADALSDGELELPTSTSIGLKQMLFSYMDLKVVCDEQALPLQEGNEHLVCMQGLPFIFVIVQWYRELEAVRQEQAAPLVEENAQLQARIAELEAAARLQQGELEAARREASELREQGAQADQMVLNLQRCALVLHTMIRAQGRHAPRHSTAQRKESLQYAMQLS